MPVAQLIFLLLVANGAPVLARQVRGARPARPLDGGLRLADGRPLLGRSKTLRGVGAALICT
ncbi:MAG TPA: CDP-archaeol synthase, partial [Gammaproteobacteria bacterium]|nr:CDP-archaeol synthase [Gammaproteobacteria bacterium]